MTNEQSKQPQKGLAYREIMHSEPLADFYRQVWGKYHQGQLDAERKNIKSQGVDRVLVGLGISALALNSCASLGKDVDAVRPEVFQEAYSKPAELENKSTEVTQSSEKSIDTLANEEQTTTSGETTAEVLVPKKTNDDNYNRADLIIAGGILIAGLIATYAKQVYLGKQYAARQKAKRQNNLTGGQ